MMASFELKGRMVPCTVLRPFVGDLRRLAADVQAQVARSPEFFRRLPVLLDVAALGEERERLDLPGLVAALRKAGLVPVGVLGGDVALAEQLDLAVVTDHRPEKAAASDAAPQVSAMVVDRPVRSGQQIYAKGRDLIVLGSVAPGAEVIADGHVHVYGPLRGRAMAGALGDTSARIFCRELEAELVAVAGLYRVSEDLPEAVIGRSVQIRLSGQQLDFQVL
ncbi:septum site-determining protein MinC [Thermodesulfomicrobium sp. WS]|uniref:septum site-determining protein MinC n=1 Tax=Thermodesulfomicrobium sp. WS TaxID=3004129 RepID=UPI002492A633|nr:septum site-determining protein MinC [Thermodesulfomicrobium sp. WS]